MMRLLLIATMWLGALPWLAAGSFSYQGVWTRVDANGDGLSNENWVYQLSFTTTASTTVRFDMLASEVSRTSSARTDWNGDGRFTQVDTYLMLFQRNPAGNIQGNIIAQNDDDNLANDTNGSVDIYDSYLTRTLGAGSWVLAIGQYNTTTNSNLTATQGRQGWQPWQVDNNAPWRLDVTTSRDLTNVSIIPTAQFIPAPEPTVPLLAGLAGLAVWLRRRSLASAPT
jgi:hypothetical protein